MPRPSKKDEADNKKPAKQKLSSTKFVELYRLTVYNGTLFYLDKNKWESFDRYPNDTIVNAVMNDMANEYANANNMTTEIFSPNSAKAKAYRKSEDSAELPFTGIVFRNGYVDNKGFHETNDLPFTPTQVPYEYHEVDKDDINGTLMKFLAQASGANKQWIESYLRMLSTTLDNKSWTLFGILYSQKGGTGKSVIMTLLQKILGTSNFTKLKGKEVFDGSNTFALRGINNKSMIVINEMQERLPGYASEKIKMMADNDYVPYDSKGSNLDKTKMLGTVIATTNYSTQFNEIESALIDRVQRWEFKNDKKDLSTDEWGELWEPNEHMKQSLLTLLVNSYVRLNNDTKKLRGYKFESGETNHMWNEIEENDVVLSWIIDNQAQIDGKDIDMIYAIYCHDTSRDATLPKLNSNNPLAKKLNKVMDKNRKQIDGVKKTRYWTKNEK